MREWPIALCVLLGCAGAAPTATSGTAAVSYTHLRAHETVLDLVCRLLLAKKKSIVYIDISNHIQSTALTLLQYSHNNTVDGNNNQQITIIMLN